MNTGPLGWGISYSALLWALAVCAPEPAVAAPQETVLYSFTGGPDGAFPLSELLITKNGALIGTTSQGGDLNGCGGAGCGVVFELTPPPAGRGAWKETVLHRFKGGSDGAAPLAGVLMDMTGALYGATSAGGGGGCYSYSSLSYVWFKVALIGCGTMFKLTPPAAGHPVWTETVLYPFQGKDGRIPTGVPLMERTGVLYGVTAEGGEGPCGYFNSSGFTLSIPTGCGTVFRLTPPAAGNDSWALTTLHKFTSKPDGAFPDGGATFAPDGSLLGTTHGDRFGKVATYYSFGRHTSYHYSAGTVFRLTPPASGSTVWSQAILYAFGKTRESGDGPLGALYRGPTGALFGTTTGGGGFGWGVVFRLSPPELGNGRWAETTLHSFRGPDFIKPSAGLIHDAASGAFYGVTGGGGNSGGGTVFSLTRPAAGRTLWRETVLHAFDTSPDGQNPQARLAIGKAGNLYGTTEDGGAHGNGTVFKVSP
jgi:uncharacterized repeat protein (TIGR03803 family)